jgi:hypothetical protein
MANDQPQFPIEPNLESQAESQSESQLEPAFQADIDRLDQLTLLTRWAIVLGLWLTVGAVSLWGLRLHLWLLWQHFTWVGLRYAFLLNRFYAMGLWVCVLMTLSVLITHSRNVLFGRSAIDQERLHQRLLQIKQQGESHPLWRWLYGKTTA